MSVWASPVIPPSSAAWAMSPRAKARERLAVRLQRVGGPPVAVVVADPQRLAERGEHLGRLDEEGVDQFDSEVSADAVAEGVVGAPIDRHRVHPTDLTLRHRKQRLDERLGIDRLGDVVVHSRSQTHFPIARHRVAVMATIRGRSFGAAFTMRRLASSPSICGICTSIKTTS